MSEMIDEKLRKRAEPGDAISTVDPQDIIAVNRHRLKALEAVADVARRWSHFIDGSESEDVIHVTRVLANAMTREMKEAISTLDALSEPND